jgi:hypothetical protein
LSHAEHVARACNALGTVIDAVNLLRNRGSMSHANDELLEEPEAMLAINSARTVLHYVDARERVKK